MTLVVTKDGVDEKTEEHRSDVPPPVSGIHAVLRGSDRQLLKRGRGGFGVLPGDQVQMPPFVKGSDERIRTDNAECKSSTNRLKKDQVS